ncbi:MAG: hypothetical protein ACKVQC_03910 [Elusimicrobiota bacterium]
MINDTRIKHLKKSGQLKKIQGTYFRAVPEDKMKYALEDGPSYKYFNRYNLMDQFGALYFSDKPEVCRATIEKRGLLPHRMKQHVLLSFDIHLHDILDLTDPKVHIHLGLHIEDFLKSSEIPNAYKEPHEFVTNLYSQGDIVGLLCPDVTRTGNTLVIYPARVLSKNFITFKNSERLI